MAISLTRFKSAWNAFLGRDAPVVFDEYGSVYAQYSRPDRTRYRIQNERNLISSMFNRIAVSCASIDVKHVRLNDKGNYKEVIPDHLHDVFSKEANVDQTGRAFIQDVVHSMLDEGVIAVVPIYTTANPRLTDSFDVLSARVGKIVEWRPAEVKVQVYNELTGRKEEVLVQKRYTPILENPFYAIMNEPNSTLQRWVRVLNQLDKVNNLAASGKADIFVQVPYQLKSPLQKAHAEERRNAIEKQIEESPHGIVYIDGAEKVIQLNRSLENNLWEQANTLREELFSQLGLSKSVFDGTADEKTMLNYYSEIVEPILTCLVEEFERKWISRTASTQKQAIRFYRDPFKLVPVKDLAEMSDKFTRNEIMTSNEIRTKMGLPPSDDPKADQLVNSNLNQPDEKAAAGKEPSMADDIQNELKNNL